MYSIECIILHEIQFKWLSCEVLLERLTVNESTATNYY